MYQSDEKSKSLKNKIRLFIIITILLALCFLSVGSLLIKFFVNQQKKDALYELKGVTEYARQTIDLNLQGNFYLIEGIASAISSVDNFDSEVMDKIFKKSHDVVHFNRLGIADINGNAKLVDKYGNENEYNISNEEFFKQVLSEKKNIQTTIYNESLNTIAISYAVPYYKNGNFQGVVIALEEDVNISKIIDETLFSGKIYTNIINDEGQIVLGTNFDYNGETYNIENFGKIDYLDRISIYKNLKSRKSGMYIFKNGLEIMYAAYVPLKYDSSLSVLCVVSQKSAIGKQIKSLIGLFILFIISLLLFITICVIFLIEIQNNAKKLKFQNERFRLLQEVASKTIIEYYVKQDRFISSNIKENGDNSFISVDNYIKEKKYKRLLHEDYWDTYENIFEELIESPRSLQCELKFYIDNEYKWYRLFYRSIEDSKGKVDYIIGTTVDINDLVIAKEISDKKATLDLLSGMYNKDTTENKIKDIMGKCLSDEICAMFMIDLDNFKNVNDTFGHQTGDKTINVASTYLTRLCRQDDIVGRVGGDEFMVFMVGNLNYEIIENRAKQICTSLNFFVGDIHICASVGVCIMKCKDFDFDKMYSKSDESLYIVKKGEKGLYHINYG